MLCFTTMPRHAPDSCPRSKRIIEAIMKNPGIGTFTRERETFNQAIEAWRSKRSIYELWKVRGHWVPVQLQ